MEEILKKVVLLGDSAVGKTSLMNRFIQNAFSDSYISTVGAKVSKKVVNIKLGHVDYAISFMLWDIIGSEGYKSTQSRHIAGLNGAIVVADLSRPETISKLEEYWIPLLYETTAEIMPPILFVGNKLDLVDKEHSDKALGDFAALDARVRTESVIKRYNILEPYVVTSAKTGVGVEEGFRSLAVMMVMDHENYDPLTRQMEEMVADTMYEMDERKTAKSVLDMVITDFPYVVQSSEVSTLILQDCFGKSAMSKDRPTPKGTREIIDCLLRNARDKGASEENIVKYREKWLEKLKRFG
ncbi:MAG: GTP-binding protein [Candidatus Thermoplasmatota archaeon]|nr:GTP-binding protein [Euryarchaeota archaeon]MBU4031676.1 GTP-binding protein [Candidatus Thermoplasmatota archaeon]MBU4071285.1 GTP-binding protein [Candidatus Thermoplasmatota archaeon]MBU4144337.1 GTP-binding protein [Candidatus Thermoplasmatota archaeon]MBU4591933.1 GTP-binding protein [Candidatus Thermoplasmatota archaeon]